MKRQFIVMAALALAGTAFAADCCKTSRLTFSQLPFTEGKLFVSVTCGDTQVLAKAVEVEGDTVSIPVDLSEYFGQELHVQAFQDLNENNTLDFDGYGRPTEPCLQTNVKPNAEHPMVDLKLMQY